MEVGVIICELCQCWTAELIRILVFSWRRKKEWENDEYMSHKVSYKWIRKTQVIPEYVVFNKEVGRLWREFVRVINIHTHKKWLLGMVWEGLRGIFFIILFDPPVKNFWKNYLSCSVLWYTGHSLWFILVSISSRKVQYTFLEQNWTNWFNRR